MTRHPMLRSHLELRLSKDSQVCTLEMFLRTTSLRSNPSAHSIGSDGTSTSASTRPSIHYEDPPAFRKVKLLPYELCERCIIYFEEGLCRF